MQNWIRSKELRHCCEVFYILFEHVRNFKWMPIGVLDTVMYAIGGNRRMRGIMGLRPL